jgi:hypothetical protein
LSCHNIAILVSTLDTSSAIESCCTFALKMGDDVEELRAELQSCPSDHSDQSLYLSKLALSLYARFEQRGVLSDLDEAIDLNQAALVLHPPGHSNRSDSLNSLAICLYARFQQRGVLSSVAAVTVFGGFNPNLEPGLSLNLTGPNRAINIGSTKASRGLALVPKPAQTTFKHYLRLFA